MSDKIAHRKFEGTEVDENGNLHAIAKPDVVTDVKHEVKHTKFDGTTVDENGNLHAVARPDVELYEEEKTDDSEEE